MDSPQSSYHPSLFATLITPSLMLIKKQRQSESSSPELLPINRITQTTTSDQAKGFLRRSELSQISSISRVGSNLSAPRMYITADRDMPVNTGCTIVYSYFMVEFSHDRAQRLLEEYHALYRRQRRLLIEIAIAVGFICLLGGFLAGAGWHYTRQEAKEIIIEVPVESAPEKPKNRA